jgi:hypothetical protein
LSGFCANAQERFLIAHFSFNLTDTAPAVATAVDRQRIDRLIENSSANLTVHGLFRAANFRFWSIVTAIGRLEAAIHP